MAIKTSQSLDALAKKYGIATRWTDVDGHEHRVPTETIASVLTSLGAANNELGAKSSPLLALDPTFVLTKGSTPATHILHVGLSKEAFEQGKTPIAQRVRTLASGADEATENSGCTTADGGPATAVQELPQASAVAQSVLLKWTVFEEHGAVHSGTTDSITMAPENFNGEEFIATTLKLPGTINLGYHRLLVALYWQAEGQQSALVQKEAKLIVAPERCFLPEHLAAGKFWGPKVELQGTRSTRNWGIGDFTDLKAIIAWCAAQGAGIVALAALHEVDNHGRSQFTPALPSHRSFINIAYIDVEATEDFHESEDMKRLVASPAFQEQLDGFRKSETVELDMVAAEKTKVLAGLYEHFRRNHLDRATTRAREFRDYQHRRGLREFAIHQVLREALSRESSRYQSWLEWPDKYLRIDSPSIKEFAAANSERVEFYEYIQWLADIQLHSAGQMCFNSRLTIGLTFELSPFVSRHGAETWQYQDLFAVEASCAEPPSPYFPEGKLFDSPPFRPEQLKASGFTPLIEALRKGMYHAGALRINNLSQWIFPCWVPGDSTVSTATFVEQHSFEILSIIALESLRNQCVVIGDAEVLAHVPGHADVATSFDRFGILSHDYLLLDTQEGKVQGSGKDASGIDLPSQDFPAARVLEFAPPDLAPLAPFWRGEDLNIRAEHGLLPDKTVRDRLIEKRVLHRIEILRLLEKHKLLPENVTTDPASVRVMTPELASAMITLLAKSQAAFILFRLEDFFGVPMPLVVHNDTQYPSWKVKSDLAIEDLYKSSRVEAVVDSLQNVRGCYFDLIDQERFFEDTEETRFKTSLPSASYRVQLGGNFTIGDAANLVDYLSTLGISHLYLSPILASRSGSEHGYDIVNHHEITPSLGRDDDLTELSSKLKESNMAMILDIVPNHMGIGKENKWWSDVLEHGPASLFADYFDIDWQPVKKELWGKVLLPILGASYGEALKSGQLKLAFDSEKGKFKINYFEHDMPLSPVSYGLVLGRRLDVLAERLGTNDPDYMNYRSIVDALESLPEGFGLTHEETVRRLREFTVSTSRLTQLCLKNPTVLEFIKQTLTDFDCSPTDHSAVSRMHNLLEKQSYRLAFWRVAAHEINYRRFFDINDLAGVRVEDSRVFLEMHDYLLTLIKNGIVQGLRIDHPDGLYDPAGYFQALQEGARARLEEKSETPSSKPVNQLRQEELPVYIVGEKILAPFERMEKDWLVHGTTGYDFLIAANGLFVKEGNAHEFTELYQLCSREETPYEDMVYSCKQLIMQTALASELNVLAHKLNQIAESTWMYRDYTLNALRHALSEVLAYFPVYRTYVKEGTVSDVSREYISYAVRLSKRNNPIVHPGIFDFIAGVLTLRRLKSVERDEDASDFDRAVLEFAMKFQQLSGPVMAKSLEDTLFYKYNRFVALNEVGGEPQHFGLSIADFHAQTEQRQRSYPYSMLATSTHDTKRSEDVRARLSVLSEIPDSWQERVLRWMDYNRGKYIHQEEQRIPTPNDEYLIYQTLVGTYPVAGITSADEMKVYCQRIQAYILKAAREAKDNTSWINQNQAYEQGITTFIAELLRQENLDGSPDPFFVDFLEFHNHIHRMGLLKSLSQTALKLTCPGVPDFYQGNELWDFSLVDPDNRRPVDFELRRDFVKELEPLIKGQTDEKAIKLFLDQAMRQYEDGRLKLYLTMLGLQARSINPKLFTRGKYTPLGTTGNGKDDFIAYMREYGGSVLIVIAPVMVTKLMSHDSARLYSGPEETEVWTDTRVLLPRGLQGRKYRNLITGESMVISDRRPLISSYLKDFPVAILSGQVRA